jgi:hypothetical protein
LTSKFKKCISIISFAASVWVVVATSTIQHYLDNGTFDVASDCVSPTAELTISTSNDQIASPTGVSYTDLGFPTTTVVLGQDSTGTVGGKNRVCKTTYRNGTVGEYIFECFDNDQPVCSIYFKKKT